MDARGLVLLQDAVRQRLKDLLAGCNSPLLDLSANSLNLTPVVTREQVVVKAGRQDPS